jgi:hypothetical protein
MRNPGLPPMACRECGDLRFIEGSPGTPLLSTPEETTALLEACIASRSGAALLYSANLPSAFFDLSSTQAGAVLQRLRTYQIRLAVVCEPGAVTFSSRFGEMLAEERRRGDFGMFATRDDALAWLRIQSA